MIDGAMTVFIFHAAPDLAAAESLESLLERRGQFVERDNGDVALPPFAERDVAVVLLSRGLVADANKLRLTQRALDAWSVGRLLLARLDDSEPPIGLRDLAMIDASVQETRDLVWIDVATSIQRLSNAAPGDPAPRPPRKFGGVAAGLAVLGLLAPGLLVTAVLISIWLVNRIGPRPGGLGELLAGVDMFGRYYGLPNGLTPVLFAAALALMFAVLLWLAWKIVARGGRASAAAGGDGVYVSAAPEDRAQAEALIAQAQAAGAPAPRAQTVEAAAAILVVCSPAAYRSDQVKRDLFMADRNGKRVLPLFLDSAPPPEDFAYFFSADAGIALHQHEGARQAHILAAALGAPAQQAAAPAAAS